MQEATDEQRAVIEHNGNCVITARPGSGKTFCVVRKIYQIQNSLPSYQGVIAISFTNKASDELLARCQKISSVAKTSFFGTIDKFCLIEIIFQFGAHFEPLFGIKNIIEKFADDSNFKILESFNPMSNFDECAMVRTVLRSETLSLACIGRCAFVLLRELPECQRYIVSRYAWIFIDEYQDSGYYQHKIFRKLVELGILGCAVGDIDQAIYGFTNKTEKYLVELTNDSSFAHFEIKQNWRCDKAITAYSLRYLGINVDTIASERRRVFEIAINGDESTIVRCLEKYIPLICKKYSIDDMNEVAILGSSNGTLDLMSAEILLPFHRYGETALDKGFSKCCLLWRDLLCMLLGRVPYAGDFVDSHYKFANTRERMQIFETVDNLSNLRIEDYICNINEFQTVSRICLHEEVDADDLTVLKEALSDAKRLEDAYKEKISGHVNILTYHKAKGLEFDVVFCLEMYEYVLPRFNSSALDEKQAVNMFYVGVTRARKVCYIPLGAKRHNAKGDIKEANPSSLLLRNGVKELCNQARRTI